MSSPFFEAYAIGICSASICTNLPIENAVQRMNDLHPTGIESRWALSGDETFATGQPMPCPCDQDPSRTHYLLTC